MWVECDCHRSSVEFLCGVEGPLKHRPVTKVQTIEYADRQDRRSWHKGKIRDPVENSHSLTPRADARPRAG